MGNNGTISAPVDSAFGRLVEELTARLQAGEAVDWPAVARDHPDHAAELDAIRPALEMLGCLSRAGDAAVTGVAAEVTDEEVSGVLGDFRLIREVGRGGMGVVYDAEQLSLGRRVALKVLPYAGALDAKQLQRFKNEAKAAASLRHEHIVQVHAIGCERGVHFYAMEFIEGQTLADIITVGASRGRQRPVTVTAGDLPPSPPLRGRGVGGEGVSEVNPSANPSPKRGGEQSTAPIALLSTERTGPNRRNFYRSVAETIADAADALEHAHSLGIVHRDVKPGNLLLDADGKVYVSDFGLARFGPDAGLTMSGDLLGTLRYMAPEQALARHGLADHRADVYGLGATLYELLTGNPAVGGTEKADIVRRLAFEEPVAPRKLDKAIPAELETIALKCLAKNPAERYTTAGELAADLRYFLADRPIQAKPPGLRERAARWARRHRALTIIYGLLTLVLVLGAAAGTATWFWRDAESARDRAETALAGEAEAREGEAEARRGLAAIANLNRVNLAHRAWMDGEIVRARLLLDRCAEESRNWEWRYVHRLCQDELILPLETEGGGWLQLAFSPDGRRLAGTGKRVIKVWDTESGRELLALEHGWQRGVCVAFSPDGTRLAAGGGVWDTKLGGYVRGEAKVWDLATGRQELVLRHPPNYVHLIAFSPDGCRLATGQSPAGLIGRPPTHPKELPIVIWDLKTGSEVSKLVGHTNRPTAFTFSPDGRRLVSAALGQPGVVQMRTADSTVKSGHKEVKAWDLAIGKELDGFVLADEGPSYWLALSPDGRRLASTIGEKKSLQVWDLETRKLVIPSWSQNTGGAAFSADGQRLAVFGQEQSADAVVQILDLTGGTAERVWRLKGPARH
ncbi:MAG TPA: serine/threonine-protein kinase, partial [Gemmataceae bacterium]|nr:serine/threonine-protein kinase [Gemmataceae bacterium]